MSHTLLEQWQSLAYNEKADRGQLQRFWGSYFQIEKEIYEQLLENPDEEVKGTGSYHGRIPGRHQRKPEGAQSY